MLQSKSFNQLKESVSFCTRLIYIWIKEKDMIQIPENIAELKIPKLMNRMGYTEIYPHC